MNELNEYTHHQWHARHEHGWRRRRRRPRMGRLARGGTLTGNIRVHENFHSHILGNRRRILVYLPPGYTRRDRIRYPVLYVNDGQNLFDSDTAFAGIDWGMDETLENLIYQGEIREIIVVAIYNTPDRDDEYTPVADPYEGGGYGDDYAQFLIQELKPFIDQRYKTSPYPEETGIMGSSYGGLSALYTGWMYPEVFSIVAALSPSLWWADRHIIDYIAEEDTVAGPSKIWLDMGTEEGDDEEDEDEKYESVEEARMMADVLVEKGYEIGVDLFYYEDEGAEHNEWAWGNRIDEVLKALFPPEE